MSSVRMCDKCGEVFSELSEGWQTATLNTVNTDEYGRQTSEAIRQDFCADCAVGTPRKKKQTELEERIADLEAQNKKLDDLKAQIDKVGAPK